jgi:hypothetical protein
MPDPDARLGKTGIGQRDAGIEDCVLKALRILLSLGDVDDFLREFDADVLLLFPPAYTRNRRAVLEALRKDVDLE